MQPIFRWAKQLEEYLSYITMVAIFLLMILITATTLRRAIFGQSIPGVHKFSIMFLLPTLVMLSFAKLDREGGQISVELLSNKLPEQILWIRDIIYQLLLAAILLLMIKLTGDIFWENLLKRSTAAGTVAFPVYVSNFIVPLGFSVLLLRIVLNTAATIKKVKEGVQA